MTAKKGRKVLLVRPPFPKFPAYGVMHCKIFAMWAKDYLRIAVSSANLVDYDYNQVQNVNSEWIVVLLFTYMCLHFRWFVDCVCAGFTAEA